MMSRPSRDLACAAPVIAVAVIRRVSGLSRPDPAPAFHGGLDVASRSRRRHHAGATLAQG